MSEKPLIEVEKLSKNYRLGDIGIRTFWEDCQSFGKKLGLPFAFSSSSNQFTALDQVSFNVNEGEVLGIIGSNGAGKSTLLKILSRITEPTSGKANLRGRVCSLLEVGTGFHGDMTGRENIFLNGSLYGLSRSEVKSHLDSIVDFAQIENFLDTPVKRYSSGMYVRLAFAVSAHLEPEILIIDEVLAVGDVDFQKKCLGKMKDVSQSGRTILFVSHQLGMVRNLCTRALHISQGEICFDGNTDQAISHYLNANKSIKAMALSERKDRTGAGNFRFEKVELLGDPKNNNTILSGRVLTITLTIKIIKKIKSDLYVAVAIYDEWGTQLTDLSNQSTRQKLVFGPNTAIRVACHVPRLPLKHGRYRFNCYMRSSLGTEDFIENAGDIEVNDGDFFETGHSLLDNQGCILIDQNWHLIP